MEGCFRSSPKPSVLFCVGTDLICSAFNRPTTTTLGSRETRARQLLFPVSISSYH